MKGLTKHQFEQKAAEYEYGTFKIPEKEDCIYIKTQPDHKLYVKIVKLQDKYYKTTCVHRLFTLSTLFCSAALKQSACMRSKKHSVHTVKDRAEGATAYYLLILNDRNGKKSRWTLTGVSSHVLERKGDGFISVC